MRVRKLVGVGRVVPHERPFDASPSVVPDLVRFDAVDRSIDVTLVDNPATRDLVSMLPLSLPFEDLSGQEKVAYFPRELDVGGHDAENMDLMY